MDATLSGFSQQVNLESQQNLRAAWARILVGIPWDCFGTHTWRGRLGCSTPERFGRHSLPPYGPEACMRHFTGWLGLVLVEEAKRRGLGRRFYEARRAGRAGAQAIWAVGIERHKSGVTHLHSLIKWPSMLPNVRRDEAWKLWYSKRGMARFEPPADRMSVAEYVSKYVCKGGDVELSPSLTAARLRALRQDADTSAAGLFAARGIVPIAPTGSGIGGSARPRAFVRA